jgi:hypothetical protein
MPDARKARLDVIDDSLGFDAGLTQSLSRSPVTRDIVPGLAQLPRGVVATAA